jgi:uncharacterized membrane protein HdeD (DUF308 family)
MPVELIEQQSKEKIMMSPVMSSRSLASRGAAALILGIVTLLLPGPILVGLTLVIGGYVLVNGISALASALKKGVEGRGWLFLEAAVCIFAGFAIFVRPLFSVFGLTYLIGAWAVLTGAFQIGEALVLRRHIQHEGAYLFSGVLTLLLGFVILSGPLLGLRTITAMIGIYGIMFGISSLASARHVKVLEESTVEGEQRRAA